MLKIIKNAAIALLCTLSFSTFANDNASVIYFSATGHTKAAAEKLANVLNAKTYEIIPSQKYSADDLNYHNDNCRANVEMNTPNARPEIANDLSDAVKADEIYIGYPIWWGTHPRIIDTFVEKYNLKGKNISVFITSGGSSENKTVDDLKNNHQLNVVRHIHLTSSMSDGDISSWINK